MSGLRIAQVLGHTATVVRRRKKPAASREAFETRDGAEPFEWVEIEVEDLATVLLRFDNGACGSVSVGQVCAGHKNDLMLEICGGSGSMTWRQERQNELWIGRRDRANAVLTKDPSLMSPETRAYARLPGGHQEGWADALANVIRDIYDRIASDSGVSAERPQVYATFADGYRAMRIVEAILTSARSGGIWTTI